MRIGVHVPGVDPLGEAASLGAEAVQLFLGDPQSFAKPETRSDAAVLRSSPIPIYVHAPYRLNVCHPNPRIRVPSRKTLSQTVDAAAEIGAAAVIVHGGHAEDDPAHGPVDAQELSIRSTRDRSGAAPRDRSGAAAAHRERPAWR